MNTRTRSVLSAVLVGLMGASLVESSRGDYVVTSTDLGGAYQQDGYYYGPSLVGAAYGVFEDYINAGFVGFQLQSNYSNIQSITVSGSVSPFLSDGGVGVPSLFGFHLVSNQTANLADLAYYDTSNRLNYFDNTHSEELYNGLQQGIPGLNGGVLIAAGQSNFSITVSDPVEISETIAAAQSNGGFIVLGIGAEYGQGLDVLNSASIDVHYASSISPQNAVPEPASLTLACLGGAALALGRCFVKRRR